jgi:putative ABC transport system permease protein
MIHALVLTQTALLAVAGVVVGMLVSMALLLVGRDPLPPPSFWASIGVLSLTTAVTAAVLPAWAASRRDPIKELRVP